MDCHHDLPGGRVPEGFTEGESGEKPRVWKGWKGLRYPLTYMRAGAGAQARMSNTFIYPSNPSDPSERDS
jgi:hypothetical protein